MGIVNGLDEGLDVGALENLLLRHSVGYLERISVDSSNNGMGIRALSVSRVIDLSNDGLASGITAIKQNDDLTFLQAEKC